MYLTWLKSTKEGTYQAHGFEESPGKTESSSATGSGPVLHIKIYVKTLQRFYFPL